MRRYEALDGWRGFCAVAVALNHLWFMGHYRSASVVNNAHLFVDFFFVLSGFVVNYAYGDRLTEWRNIPSYLIRRFGRLYPLHLATLGALVLFELAQAALHVGGAAKPFSGAASIHNLVANLFLLQGMGVNDSGSWNGPSWSISVEFFLYISLAFVTFMLKGRHRSICFALLSVAGALALWRFAPHLMDSTFDFGFLRGIFGFFLGALVQRALARWPVANLPFPTILEIAYLVGIMTFLSLASRGPEAMLASPIFAGAVWLFAQEKGAVSGLMKGPVFNALGKWSFSIYLWHYVMIIFLFAALRIIESRVGGHFLVMTVRASDGASFRALSVGSPWLMDGAAALFLLATVVVGGVSYRLIEQPGQRLFGNLAKRFTPISSETRRAPELSVTPTPVTEQTGPI